jgi:hypothetical protein
MIFEVCLLIQLALKKWIRPLNAKRKRYLAAGKKLAGLLLTLGSTQGTARGIFAWIENGSLNHDIEISGNTILTPADTFSGSQYGIAYLQQSTSGTDKNITISNNTLTHCGYASPPPGYQSAGIASVVQNTDHLNATIDANHINDSVSYNGMWIARAGAGTICAGITNNTGSTTYLLNNIPGGPSDFKLHLVDNDGTFSYLPGPTSFSSGTSCP